jgi:threonyl-tRNA synthetase
MRDKDIRVDVDDRNEKIGYKIREGQMSKVPYMLVVGDKEMESNTVAVRKRGQGDLGAQAVDEFIASVMDEVAKKTI